MEAPPSQEAPSSGQDGPKDLSNIGLGEDDSQGRDTLTYERPAMDIFKAIFASDDEDSDEEEARTQPVPSAQAPSPTIPVDVPVAVPSSAFKHVKSAMSASIQQPRHETTEPVDMSTFRPTFKSKTKDSEGSKEKKKSKDKDRRKGKAILSFDDEGVELTFPEKPKRKKNKKEKTTSGAPEDDMDMWVEKAPAEGVGLPSQSPAKPGGMEVDEVNTTPSQSSGVQGGRRMRAVDFL